MSGVLWGAGIALTALLLFFMLEGMGYRGARLITVTATVVILIGAVGSFSAILSELDWLSELTGITETARTALKVIGIGYVSGLCYDISLDMGQRGLANAVMTVGRVEMLLVITPLVSDVIRLAVELI